MYVRHGAPSAIEISERPSAEMPSTVGIGARCMTKRGEEKGGDRELSDGLASSLVCCLWPLCCRESRPAAGARQCNGSRSSGRERSTTHAAQGRPHTGAQPRARGTHARPRGGGALSHARVSHASRSTSSAQRCSMPQVRAPLHACQNNWRARAKWPCAFGDLFGPARGDRGSGAHRISGTRRMFVLRFCNIRDVVARRTSRRFKASIFPLLPPSAFCESRGSKERGLRNAQGRTGETCTTACSSSGIHFVQFARTGGLVSSGPGFIITWLIILGPSASAQERQRQRKGSTYSSTGRTIATDLRAFSAPIACEVAVMDWWACHFYDGCTVR